MANLIRIRTKWTGTAVVGPAVSTFYFEEAGTGFTNSIGLMWDAVKAYIPVGTTMQTEASGDIINPVTGDVVGVWNDGTVSSITGTGGNSFIYGTGVRIVWSTAGLVNSRHVKGSTYIVPFDAGNLTGIGAVVEGTRNIITGAAQAVIASTNHVLCVWSRPTETRVGSAHPVVSSSVPDAVSWLRSRRV